MSKNIVFSDFSPRGYFIEYPLFFNYFLNTYVELHQSDFKYNKDNKTFVLKKLYSNKALESFICSEIQSLIDSLSLNNSVHSQIFIIADSGDLRKEKYQMLESDIDIHIKQLEKVAKILFNKFFTRRKLFNTLLISTLVLMIPFFYLCKKHPPCTTRRTKKPSSPFATTATGTPLQN